MLKTVSSITNAIGAVNYKGTWNASTNTPTLASGVGTKGDYYVVSVAGTTAIDGISNWGVGDWIVFNGSAWQRLEGGSSGNFVDLSATGAVSLPTGTGINNATPNSYYSTDLVVGAGGDGGITIASSATNVSAYLMFADGTSGSDRFRGQIRYNHATDAMTFATDASGRMTISKFGDVTPAVDANQNFGSGALRWQTIYASTPTINTSDARSKRDVESISDAEKRVALAIKAQMRKFRFVDAFERKGDGARIHFGVIAQEVEAAFIAEGLDPSRYGLFCYDEWQDEFEPVYRQEVKINEDGKEIIVHVDTGEVKKVLSAGNRYGVRYEELLAFIIAAI